MKDIIHLKLSINYRREVKLPTIWTDEKQSRAEAERREKIRREKSRRERVRRKKMQMREKVGTSRNTVFFQWFEAPEGRKVGSLKRRVRSQLARWEMKNCTPLWREAHFEVKMLKTPGVRTTFGCSDVASRGRRKGLCTLSKVRKTWGFCSIFNYNHHYTTLDSNTLHSITLNYTQLHPITLHYITLHYTPLHYTTLHYTTRPSTTLHYTTLHYTTLHYTTLPTLHYTTLPSTTLHYITLHYTPQHYNYNYTTTFHYTPLH